MASTVPLYPAGRDLYGNQSSREPTVADFVALHQRYIDAGRRAAGMPELYGDAVGDSLGAAFTGSKAYESWRARFPDGGPSIPGSFNSDPVEVSGGFRSVQEAGGFRSLVTSGAGSAGALVPPDVRGLLEPGLYRPVRVLQLLQRVPTNSDTVEFAAEVSHADAALPVAEATALTGSSGLKPEGEISWEQRTVAIRTFAVWLATTKKVVSDAPQLRGLIDNYLSADLARAVEDQVLAGGGTGQDFVGLLNQPGTQSAGPPGPGESILDTVRKARTLVEVNARTTPNAVLINPSDSESVDLLKATGTGEYFGDPFSANQPPLWGLTRVATDAIPAGTALVGDFTKATLFDREQSTLALGTVADDFLRNIIRLLGEVRLAFTCLRPSAFVLVNLGT